VMGESSEIAATWSPIRDSNLYQSKEVIYCKKNPTCL
jgi:hypothetical protein